MRGQSAQSTRLEETWTRATNPRRTRLPIVRRVNGWCLRPLTSLRARPVLTGLPRLPPTRGPHPGHRPPTSHGLLQARISRPAAGMPVRVTLDIPLGSPTVSPVTGNRATNLRTTGSRVITLPNTASRVINRPTTDRTLTAAARPGAAPGVLQAEPAPHRVAARGATDGRPRRPGHLAGVCRGWLPLFCWP